MAQKKYKITQSAAEDLLNIYRYGEQQWGENKASEFIKGLYNRFVFLTKHPEIGLKREEFHPDFRSFAHSGYSIFYQIKEHIEILTIIHSNQDLTARLANVDNIIGEQ